VRPKYEQGESVRVIRTVRNDGTFPGRDVGNVLVRRGAVGFVRDVGTFLQDQLIYSVHFVDDNVMVGCREEELLAEDEAWTFNRYEFRDKVTPRIPLGIQGVVIADTEAVGEIEKVLRDVPETGQVSYHVRFSGRTLQVPEEVLDSVERRTGEEG
jgi:nitrogen fixation protein NifZ